MNEYITPVRSVTSMTQVILFVTLQKVSTSGDFAVSLVVV